MMTEKIMTAMRKMLSIPIVLQLYHPSFFSSYSAVYENVFGWRTKLNLTSGNSSIIFCAAVMRSFGCHPTITPSAFLPVAVEQTANIDCSLFSETKYDRGMRPSSVNGNVYSK